MASSSHVPPRSRQAALTTALAVTLVMLVVEAAGGFWTRSLALLADAGHMATDAMSLVLSLLALWAAKRPPDRRRTYGYERWEVLAALANGVVLWAVLGVILREAFLRLSQPPSPRVVPMLAIALAGLAVNGLSFWLLSGFGQHDLNIRGALLHVGADALGSVGVVAAALIMLGTGWTYADPLVSALICGLVGYSSWGLLKGAVNILMEGTPSHLDLEAVRAALAGLDEVVEVHDLHLWSIASGRESLTVHLVLRPGADEQKTLRAGSAMLKERFGIGHVTLQIEVPSS